MNAGFMHVAQSVTSWVCLKGSAILLDNSHHVINICVPTSNSKWKWNLGRGIPILRYWGAMAVSRGHVHAVDLELC